MQVKIYSTTTCPYCKMEKEFLDSKGIKYENIFVDQNPEAAQKMIEESGQMGVPYTVITKEDGSAHKMLGFNQAKLAEMLGL